MKENYSHLAGKTRQDILKIMEEYLFLDPHSDEWFLYLEESYWWQKKYLYLQFEDDIVTRSSIVYKSFWNKI